MDDEHWLVHLVRKEGRGHLNVGVPRLEQAAALRLEAEGLGRLVVGATAGDAGPGG
jgi:hypothetical protein